MAAPNNSKVVQFKLVLLGESAVGKSSLVLRFVRGQFFDYQESTIGGVYVTAEVGRKVVKCYEFIDTYISVLNATA